LLSTCCLFIFLSQELLASFDFFLECLEALLLIVFVSIFNLLLFFERLILFGEVFNQAILVLNIGIHLTDADVEVGDAACVVL